jgi:hypothetical protein
MGPAFVHGELYIAISRVTRISDLTLFEKDEFSKNDPDLIEEMDHAFEYPHEF